MLIEPGFGCSSLNFVSRRDYDESEPKLLQPLRTVQSTRNRLRISDAALIVLQYLLVCLKGRSPARVL